MRKIKVIFFIAVFIAFPSFAGELTAPVGYTKIKDGKGVDLYENTTKGVYVQVVDLQGGGQISFDGFPEVADATKGTYKRFTMNNIYDYYNKKYNNFFSTINGQFFDNGSATTGVAFPVKSGGVIKSKVMSESDKLLKKRTFLIDYNNNSYSVEGYNELNLTSKTYKEAIVGLHPVDADKNKSYAIGRNFIGVYPSYCNYPVSYCSSRYVLFFIAKNKTQDGMIAIASDWGVPSASLIMMDGSGSSQIMSKKINSNNTTTVYSLYGSTMPIYYNPDKRTLPHVILATDSNNLLAR